MFLQGSDEGIYSKEGATQGCPGANSFYSMRSERLLEPEKNLRKSGFTDDINSAGELVSLAPWWTKLNDEEGPEIGYCPKAFKSWLLVKTEREAEAKDHFSGINITTGRRKHLGSFIGNHEKTVNIVGLKLIECIQDVHELSTIERSSSCLVSLYK